MKPFPSVATFRRTQRMVNCASSQLRANNRIALESAPTLAPQRNVVKLTTSFTPEPPQPKWPGGSVVYGRKRDSYRDANKKLPIGFPFPKKGDKSKFPKAKNFPELPAAYYKVIRRRTKPRPAGPSNEHIDSTSDTSGR